MTVLNGEEGLECEIHVEHVLEFKYLGCILDESGIDGADCSRKVVNGRRVEGTIKPLVNVRDLQLECARVLRETFIVPVLRQCYGWRRRDLEIGLYR